MSFVAARNDKWWPKSSKHSSHNHVPRSPQDNTHSFISNPPTPDRKPSAMKFSTITSAMSFKSKKQPSVPIQQPPSGLTVDTQTIRYANRPPAKSFSTTQSWDDEPQTPSDYPADGARLRPMTPKSATSSTIPGIRSAIHDPSRLSAYSGSSISDAGKGNINIFDRASYASSSNSQFSALSAHSSATSLIDPLTASPTRSKPHKSSTLKAPDPFGGDGDIYLGAALNKSGSSSTLTERNTNANAAEAKAASTRPARLRGLTDVGGSWGSSDFLRNPPPPPPKMASLPVPSQNERSVQPVRPRLLVRQASASRLGPPKAPPMGNLPPPPFPRSSKHDTPCHSPVSPASSSSMSFAPCYDASPSGDEDDSHFRPLHNRTIKKSISHQSFTRRPSSTHTAGAKVCAFPDEPSDRAPRRQRSFHHSAQRTPPRSSSPVQLPPSIPILSPASTSTSISGPHTPPHNSEVRRGSFTGSLVRKRLFSNASSRQPPSSQGITIEDDDLRSVNIDSALTIAIPTSSASSVVFGSSPEDQPSSPMSTSQRIMSPADMLKLEASFHDGDAEPPDASGKRQRVHSFASASTSMSDLYDSPAAPRHYVVDRRANRVPSRSSTLVDSPVSSGRMSSRPSTAQSYMDMSVFGSPSPARMSVAGLPGLPLPPRPRRQTAAVAQDLPFMPLSPPPIRRHATSNVVIQPRSIMKKPSFLDIYDDRPSTSSSSIAFAGDSFLEMEKGKDSFDTIR